MNLEVEVEETRLSLLLLGGVGTRKSKEVLHTHWKEIRKQIWKPLISGICIDQPIFYKPDEKLKTEKQNDSKRHSRECALLIGTFLCILRIQERRMYAYNETASTLALPINCCRCHWVNYVCRISSWMPPLLRVVRFLSAINAICYCNLQDCKRFWV